jgi:hypothetical protein
MRFTAFTHHGGSFLKVQWRSWQTGKTPDFAQILSSTKVKAGELELHAHSASSFLQSSLWIAHVAASEGFLPCFPRLERTRQEAEWHHKAAEKYLGL